MRTSHTAIRRMIRNEKNKLTDEQVFASARYAAYLTDIAEGITKRYKRNSRVITFWDTSENAPVADTNNRIINLNCGNRLSMSFPTKSLKADSLLGIIGHECGHILFSDFTMLDTFHQAIQDGRFYPHEPEDLSELQQDNLEEILNAFADNDKAVNQAVTSVCHTLVNIMEDVYIESKICSAFSGTVKTGILLNNLRFAEEITPIQEEIDQQHHGVFIIINLLIQYAKTGDILNLNNYKGPYLDALYQCIPYLDDAAYDDDSRTRYDAANHMLLILWPFMDSYIKQIREDQINHTSNAKEEMEKQLAAGLPLPQLTGRPVPNAEKLPASPLPGDELNHLEQVLDYENGRLALQKTDKISDNGNGGISRTNDYSGAGYVSQAAEDMDRLMTRLAEDIVYPRYEQELTEELQKEADKIRYGNAHKGIHVNINRMSYVDPSYMTAYQQVSPQLLLISRQLQRQVSQLLKDYKSGGRLDNLPMGKRINVRNTVHNDGRIFYKMKLPNDQTDIAVAILNDESGSMASDNRITCARAASIILLDFCRKLDIPVAIYGHTTSGEDVELYAYAEYDSMDDKDAFRLMDMSARGSNRDGAALRYVAERLLTRPEAVKLLILISDGQPAACGYYGTEAEADLRGIKKEYTNKGIRMFAAAIGDDKPNIQRIYGDGFLDITNPEKLPLHLGKLMIQHIRDKMIA